MVRDPIIDANEIMATHLLICYIIYVGWGLKLDLISAWKSGRKPSARRETNNKTIPKTWLYCVLFFFSGSNILNRKTPTDITIPTIILFAPSFKFLSFTLEHKTATNSIDSILQDLKAMTTGKLVIEVAQV